MDKYIKANKLVADVIHNMKDNPHNNNLLRQNHTNEHRRFITMIERMPAEEVMWLLLAFSYVVRYNI